MGNTRSSKHSSIDWLAKEPLAPHIDAYMLFLANRDYAANTFCNYLGVVSHFAQWMHSRRLRLQSIDEALIAQFLISICRDATAPARFSEIVVR
jgi:site-specific recombinase XerD